MAKITFKGLDRYLEELYKMKGDGMVTIEKSVYVGAKVIADSIKSSMNGIQTRVPGKFYDSGMAPGPIASFGLSPMRDDNGYVNTKAGFDGYGRHQTPSFPNGVPNAVVARSCESGTSWMKKQPFMRKSVNGARTAAVAAMSAKFDEEIKKIMN